MKKKLLILCLSIIGIMLFLVYLNLSNKVTQESIEAEFHNNRYYFNVVKEYLLTQPEDYYINFETYRRDISDEKVVESIRYLIKDLKYDRIYVSGDPKSDRDYFIVFTKYANHSEEFGVLYTYSKSKHGLAMEWIEDNWYFHWIGYGY